jgi:hypothetical protein
VLSTEREELLGAIIHVRTVIARRARSQEEAVRWLRRL